MKLSPRALKELHYHSSTQWTKYSKRADLKTGKRAPKPITLRLPPEKR